MPLLQDCKCFTPNTFADCTNYVDDWYGDGFCDDFLNNDVCHFDGGDCCPDSDDPMDGTEFCTVCIMNGYLGCPLPK